MISIKKIDSIDAKLYTDIFHLFVKGIKTLRDGYTIDLILKDIADKNKFLWVSYENDKPFMILITAIIDYPHCRRLLYYLIAGDKIDESLFFHENIVKDAVSYGCQEIEIFGRRGWIKKLKSLGYKLEYVAMTAKIDKDILCLDAVHPHNHNKVQSVHNQQALPGRLPKDI